MKISIITPAYNSAKTIRDTIESVIAQNYPDLEYIIIDGLSSDNTKDIVLEHKDKLNIIFISEKDKGIYDAMNKGVKIATGDIVGILNSDDFYSGDNVLSKINQVFESDDQIDAVYGDLVYVDKNDTSKKTRFWKSGNYTEKKLDWGWIIPHPTFFVKCEVYKKDEKLFDTSFSLAGDYEFILRKLKINKIKVKYLPETLVTMRDGGASGSSLNQRIKGWEELRNAWKVNNLKIPPFFILRRVLSKVGQYLNNS